MIMNRMMKKLTKESLVILSKSVNEQWRSMVERAQEDMILTEALLVVGVKL